MGSVIAWIQAAPDLMNAGFKVYLRDESPTISRNMAKPDKIFQKNEHSNCILTSRPAYAGRRKHRISHQRKGKSSSGEAGKSKLKPILEPRYVDEEKYIDGGAQVTGANEKVPLSLARDKISHRAVKAQAIITVCPLHNTRFDTNQSRIERRFNENYNLPGLHYPQFLGLAWGFRPEEPALKEHRVNPSKAVNIVCASKN